MKKNIIITFAFSFLFCFVYPSISSAQVKRLGKMCEPIGRTISIPSKYICPGDVYTGPRVDMLCFSSGKIIALKDNQKPKGCSPSNYRLRCDTRSSDCPISRGEEGSSVFITSDPSFLDRSPTFSWTSDLNVKDVHYNIVLRDVNRLLVWSDSSKNNSIVCSEELNHGLYDLSVIAIDSHGGVIGHTRSLVYILSPEEISVLNHTVNIIHGLDLDPSEARKDLAIIYSSFGLYSRARLYLSLQDLL